MAKKVVNTVVIKDEELTPTTLGVYSNKAKSPVGLFILIIIFLVLAIFMPNISSYIDKYTGKDVDEGPVVVDNGDDNKEDDDEDEPEVVEVEKYTIDPSTIVETDLYTISNINLNGNKLELSIINKSSENLNLDTYYFEQYSDTLTLLERVKVGEDVIAPGNSVNKTFTINSTPTKFTFVSKTEEDYPVVKLKYNDNQEATITCTKGIETYNYIFVNDALAKVDYKYSATNVTDANYSVELFNKTNKANSLNTLTGITSTVTSTDTGYVFNIIAVLSEADISQLQDKNFFKNKTTANEVVFKTEARGFKCN